MKSTNLFRTAVLLTLLTLWGAIDQSLGAETGKQYYEFRVYTTKSEQQQKLINDHWQKSAIPAYNRIGIQPIGVFTEQKDSATNRIYVLVPCDSIEAFAAIPQKLAADADYQKAAGEYLNLSRSNSAYQSIESSLLVAFDGMKQLSAPPEKGDRSAWVFELRTYLSQSEGRGKNKVDMFNAGEIQVMKDVGLAPIFYGQMLVGSQIPCLVYMTAGENMEEHQKHWKAFNTAPGWNKLKNDPQYQDNMHGMTRIMLKRTPASQL